MTRRTLHVGAFGNLISTLFTLLATVVLSRQSPRPPLPKRRPSSSRRSVHRSGGRATFNCSRPRRRRSRMPFLMLDTMLPLEGPGVAVYTPHAGPYDTELSTNAAAAASSISRSSPGRHHAQPQRRLFRDDVAARPGHHRLLARFASGPVIPNSLFPFTSHAEMLLNGAKVETLQDQLLNVRAGDVGFDGASHRRRRRSSGTPGRTTPMPAPWEATRFAVRCRDIQGNGWNIVAPFTVVPEPSTWAIAVTGLISAFGIVRLRKSRALGSA